MQGHQHRALWNNGSTRSFWSTIFTPIVGPLARTSFILWALRVFLATSSYDASSIRLSTTLGKSTRIPAAAAQNSCSTSCTQYTLYRLLDLDFHARFTKLYARSARCSTGTPISLRVPSGGQHQNPTAIMGITAPTGQQCHYPPLLRQSPLMVEWIFVRRTRSQFALDPLTFLSSPSPCKNQPTDGLIAKFKPTDRIECRNANLPVLERRLFAFNSLANLVH